MNCILHIIQFYYIIISVLTKQGRDKTPEELEMFCGANFCPGVKAENITLLNPPDWEEVQIMTGIYLGCSFIAIFIVAVFVDPLRR